MSDIAGLIAKLEAAAEGSCELDNAVAYALFKRAPQSIFTPKHTTSIDAALTLVPEGMEWCISNRGQIGADHLAFAGVFGKPFVGSECDSHGATPAIAICIASLKARTAQK